MSLKLYIRKIDQALFSGFFERSFVSLKEYPDLQPVKKQNPFRIECHYSKNRHNPLSELCDYYGSDKGEIDSNKKNYHWPSHTYTDFYDMIFSQSRKNIKNILECGIGSDNKEFDFYMGEEAKPGASLRVWNSYFPNAQVYGVDIDERSLFEEDRIKTYQVDQTSKKSIESFLGQVQEVNFDIIIDDGLHHFSAGICFFENMIHRLGDNGVYFIEDVTVKDLKKYSAYFAKCEDKYYARFINLHRDSLNLNDNSIVMVTKLG